MGGFIAIITNGLCMVYLLELSTILQKCPVANRVRPKLRIIFKRPDHSHDQIFAEQQVIHSAIVEHDQGLEYFEHVHQVLLVLEIFDGSKKLCQLWDVLLLKQRLVRAAVGGSRRDGLPPSPSQPSGSCSPFASIAARIVGVVSFSWGGAA